MKKKISIFTNIKNNLIFKQLLPNNDLVFKPLDELTNKNNFLEPKIIFLNNNDNAMTLDENNISNECFLVTNLPRYKSDKKNILFIDKPVKIGFLKNQLGKFLSNIKINYKDISIIDSEIINITNELHCNITDIEKEILMYLFNTELKSKQFIKENILNIKSDIETNSLDSHLSRIRKKFNKIKSRILITSKNDQIFI